MDDYQNGYGARVKRLREDRGKVAAWVGREVEIRHGIAGFTSTLSKIERGVRPIRLNEAEAILDVLGADWHELVDYIGDYDRDTSRRDSEAVRAHRAAVLDAEDALGPLMAATGAFTAALARARRAEAEAGDGLDLDADGRLANVKLLAAQSLSDVLRMLPADALAALGDQFKSSRRRRRAE